MTWGIPAGSLNLSQLPCGSQEKSAQEMQQMLIPLAYAAKKPNEIARESKLDESFVDVYYLDSPSAKRRLRASPLNRIPPTTIETADPAQIPAEFRYTSHFLVVESVILADNSPEIIPLDERARPRGAPQNLEWALAVVCSADVLAAVISL